MDEDIDAWILTKKKGWKRFALPLRDFGHPQWTRSLFSLQVSTKNCFGMVFAPKNVAMRSNQMYTNYGM